jgi:hypothetical protein
LAGFLVGDVVRLAGGLFGMLFIGYPLAIGGLSGMRVFVVSFPLIYTILIGATFHWLLQQRLNQPTIPN